MHDSIQTEGAPLSEEERIAANRAAIFSALRDEGVLRAAVSYTGSGDSGGPDGVRFEMPDGPRELDCSIKQQVRVSTWVRFRWKSGGADENLDY